MMRRVEARIGRALLLVIPLLVLAGCVSAPPPAPQGKAVEVGDWTVRSGGYVRADAGVVSRR